MDGLQIKMFADDALLFVSKDQTVLQEINVKSEPAGP